MDKTEDIVEEVVDDAPKEPDPQVIERARTQGWVPKEEFRGDDSRWITAEEFVDRADNMMPILKSVNKKLEGKLSSVEEKLASAQDTMNRMIKVQKKYTKDTYESRLSELRLKKRDAAKNDDMELYDKLEIEEAKLEPPKDELPDPDKPRRNPDIVRWEEENSDWYGTDQEMTEYADFIAKKMGEGGKDYGNPYDFAKAVEKKVKKTFATKFQNNPNNQTIDEPAQRGGEVADTGKKGWNDLPGEAKAQCLRQIEEMKELGSTYTKEQYLKDYFEGE